MNSELLLQIADMIEQYPESYDQGTWGTFNSPDRTRNFDLDLVDTGCGTSMCIAGWAAFLTDWHPVMFLWEGSEEAGDAVWGLDWDRLVKGKTRLSTQAAVYSASRIGREELDLASHEADVLFDGDNWWTPDQLREMAERGSVG